MEKKRWAIYITATVLIVGLSVALGIAAYRHNRYKNQLENLYEKSYYEALNAIGNIDISLAKLEIAVNTEEQQDLLKAIWRDTSVTEANLSQLGARKQSIESITKFINQLGDYCFFISLKIDEGINISTEEQENLKKSHKVISAMQEAMYEVQGKIEEGGKLMGKFNQDLNFLSSAVAKINTSTAEYPGLIYDGPFSDGLSDREPIVLQGLPEISAEDAKDKIHSYFADKQITDVKQDGEAKGNIPSYIFSFTIENKPATVYISKQGGKMVLFDAYKDVNAVNDEEQECVDIAIQFVEDIGYTNMVPVWINNNNSTIYINFSYKKDNVIVYCDQIKVKVEASSGEVIGLEAKDYIYNHKERNYQPEKTMAEARTKVSSKVNVTKERLAIIPTEWNTEKLVYEFIGDFNNKTYFIYVNANTLKGEGILLVVEDSGELVI